MKEDSMIHNQGNGQSAKTVNTDITINRQGLQMSFYKQV